MSVSDDAGDRLQLVLAESGLVPVGAPELIASHSNDAWMLDDPELGPVVLRVCWRGDRQRLLREAAVARELPAAVSYPTQLRSGRVAGRHDVTWSLTRRLPGSTLLDAWPSLDTEQRRSACRAVATMLEALHRWRPSSALIPLLIPDPPPHGSGAAGIAGRSLVPLPLPYARELLDLQWDELGPSVRVRLRDYLDAVPPWLVPIVDAPELGVIHADLHLSNIWCDGRAVTALLDLEWVRLAPPYVELVRLKDNVDADELEGRSEHRLMYDLLREDYPVIFEADQLDQRIRFLQVLCELRQLAVWGTPTAGVPRAPDHPLHNLTRLLRAADDDGAIR